MKLSTVARRLLAGAATLTVGAVGALAVASPASAHHPIIEVDKYCDEVTGEYVITWEVKNSETDIVGELTQVSLTPEAELSEITEGATLPMKGDGTLTDEQRVAGDTVYAELEVAVFWDRHDGVNDDATKGVEFSGDCAATSEVVADYNCETFDLSIENKSNEEATFTVVPSEGDSVDVTVPAGETSESVSFDSQEGLTVDVELGGESVVDEGPFEITSEDWEKLGCGDDGGEGGSNEDEELPVTGSTTLLIAGAAVALLALGGGLFLVARRRRLTFTA